MQKNQQIILGIDPGTLMMGYGLIAIDGSHVEMLEMNILKLSTKKDHYERLSLIHEKVTALIRKFHPHQCAIEAPFFGKNVQSMLKLGRAQGVAIAAAMQAGIPVTEYAPRKIKQSITGNGNAGKDQVWSMLQRIIFIKDRPRYFDASDALAVAICHHFQSSSPIAKASAKTITVVTARKKLKAWEEFLDNNPHRIRQG